MFYKKRGLTLQSLASLNMWVLRLKRSNQAIRFLPGLQMAIGLETWYGVRGTIFPCINLTFDSRYNFLLEHTTLGRLSIRAGEKVS